MKKAVVTGACGFVGRALTECLRQKGVEVLAVGLSRHRERARFGSGVVFGAADEMTESDWERMGEGAEVFYHLGWSGSAGEGRKDGLIQTENIRQALLSLRQAERLGCRKWIGAGSIAETEAQAAEEQGLPPAEAEIYGWAKRAAWALCRRQSGNTAALWGRITNAYGEGEHSSRLICHALGEIAAGRKPVFTAGRQMYDFIHISDAAEAFFLLGEKGRPGQAYTIGSGQAKPLRQWIELLLEETGGEGAFSRPFAGPFLTAEDFEISHLREDTGFSCRVDFREGIRRAFRWQKERIAWEE